MADIELVIKIPEEIYKASQIIDVKYEDNIQIPLEVIANGIPLPKGHGDLIDRREFQKDDYFERRYGYDFYREFQNRLKRQLTIIEADKENTNE